MAMKKKIRLSATLCVLGCAAFAAAPKDNATDLDIVSRVKDVDGDGVIRVACVGDSITAGTHEYNYPKFLGEQLAELGKANSVRYSVKNHGKGGAAVRHVRERVDVNGDGVKDDYFYYDDRSYLSSLEYTPDVVIVQMGTNDSLFKNWDAWNDYIERDYLEFLVKPYREKGALVVVSTPPYACNGMHDGNVNGPVHERVVAFAKKNNLPVVDMNRLLFGRKEFFADGLHCNATGYTMMALGFTKHVFGGKFDTLSLKGRPGTRVTLADDATSRHYVVELDRKGEGTLPFLAGRRTFGMEAQCKDFKKLKGRVTLAPGGKTVTLDQKPGDYNYAWRGVAKCCDAKPYGNSDVRSITDGHRRSGGYQTERFNAGDWCAVELDRPVKSHSVVLYWETATFVSEYRDGGYALEFMSGGKWKDAKAAGVTGVERRPYSGDIVVDTVSLAKPVPIEGVKVVFLDGKCSHQYAPKLYELEVLSDVPPPPPANPLFEGWYADPQIRRYGDTYWIFPTYSHDYHEQMHIDVFSSKDLKHWKKHANAVDGKDFSWVRGAMWAPDAHENNGKYYIFFGANDSYPKNLMLGDMNPQDDPGIGRYGGIGVAVADRPEGPYRDLIGKPLVDRFWNRAQPIDQYVFRYKGDWYMVYGGWGRCNLVKLAPDFKSLLPLADGKLSRDMTPKGYVEGSVMFEPKGKWYFMYSAGGWTTDNYCVNYSVGDSPFGPWEFKGKVLGVRRPLATGAGHHSVICLPGTDDWYICYHRRPIPSLSGHHRVTCLDRMYFDAKGDIKPIVMTE